MVTDETGAYLEVLNIEPKLFPKLRGIENPTPLKEMIRSP
jgi:hypothetical protein